MAQAPQIDDRVKTPKGNGLIAARSQTPQTWTLLVNLSRGGTWRGLEGETKMIETAATAKFRADSKREEAFEKRIAAEQDKAGREQAARAKRQREARKKA